MNSKLNVSSTSSARIVLPARNRLCSVQHICRAGFDEGGNASMPSLTSVSLSAGASKATSSPSLEKVAEKKPAAVVEVELKSEVGMDYTLLRDCLQKGEFQKADDETRALLIRLAGEDAVKRGWVYWSEVKFISVTDLQTIDNLWKAYSGNKFGFSVQRELWLQNKRQWQKFFKRIDWVQGENNVYRKWPAEFYYNTDEGAKGHLPLTNALRGTQLFNAILEHPAFNKPKTELNGKIGGSSPAGGNKPSWMLGTEAFFSWWKKDDPALALRKMDVPQLTRASVFPSWDGDFFTYEHYRHLCRIGKKGTVDTKRWAYVFAFGYPPTDDDIFEVAVQIERLSVDAHAVESILLLPDDYAININNGNAELPFKVVQVPRNGLEGDLFLLNAFSLTDYDRVVVLGLRLEFLRAISGLFVCPAQYDLMYTSGPTKPVGTDLLVLKPSAQSYEELRALALNTTGDLDPQRGWFGRGLPCRVFLGVSSTHTLVPTESECAGEIVAKGADLGKLNWVLWAWTLFKLDEKKSAPLDPCSFRYDMGFACTQASFGTPLVVELPGGKVHGPQNACLMPKPGCAAVPYLAENAGYTRRIETDLCKPSFFILGARQAGTLRMYMHLIQHPQITRNKAWFVRDRDVLKRSFTGETNGFVKYEAEEYWLDHSQGDAANPMNRLYRDFFNRNITGEATASYLPSSTIPITMLRVCPESARSFRFLVMVREPIARLQSAFIFRAKHKTHRASATTHAEGYVRMQLQAVKEKIKEMDHDWLERGEPLFSQTTTVSNLVYEGMYVAHLLRWVRYFGPEQFKVICAEDDFWGAPERRSKMLAETVQFLGIEPSKAVEGPIVDVNMENEQQLDSAISYIKKGGKLWKELEDFYRPYNAMLRDMLGVKCGWTEKGAAAGVEVLFPSSTLNGTDHLKDH